MKIGSYALKIRGGADEWQVFARHGNYGTVIIWGEILGEAEVSEIFLRIVSENDGREILPWQGAEVWDGEGNHEQQEERKWKAEMEIPVGGPYRLETCIRKGAVDL